MGAMFTASTKVVDAGIAGSPRHAKDVAVIDDGPAVQHAESHADNVLRLDGLQSVALLDVPVDDGLQDLDEPLVR